MPAMRRSVVTAASLIVLAAGASCRRGDSANDAILEQRPLYSQGREEPIIRHYFQDRRGGVFVDVGCADYEKRSTTYYLEKQLGWTGIGIDALEEFRAGYEQHRPGTRFRSFIVTDHRGTRETFYRIAGMLPNSSASQDYAAKWAKVAKEQGGAHATGEPQPVTVETITLDALLEREGVRHIDFLSMDIEEGEPAALRGFDIDRFEPALVCIETDAATRDFIAAYFARHGYERIERYRAYDELNWYFRPKR